VSAVQKEDNIPMRNFVKRNGHAQGSPRDHYAEITAQVVAALEAGTPPWRQPWDSNKAGGPMTPHNAVTGARYRGINTLLLGMSPLAFMSGDPRWATYKQAADRGWQVRKGSQGTPGFFYKPLEIKACESELEDERKIVHMLRSFTLFNGSQIDGIPPYVAPGVEALCANNDETNARGSLDLRAQESVSWLCPTSTLRRWPPLAPARQEAAGRLSCRRQRRPTQNFPNARGAGRLARRRSCASFRKPIRPSQAVNLAQSVRYCAARGFIRRP
jgi:hypothetical protein